MVRVYNSGEQDIEDDGISISITFSYEEGDTPDIVLINLIDNLLGISEFVTSCEYKYAEVGISYTPKEISKEYLSLLSFLNKSKNKELKGIFNKYVKFYEEDPFIDSEDNTIWYNFVVENKNSEMSDEDLVKFKNIFKGVVQPC
jgi:hypothetical protein